MRPTNYRPLRGHTLVEFSREQTETFNVQFIGGKPFVISTGFHPDQWSIEEAVIYEVSESQHVLKPGDSILVDYAIFTQGKYRGLRADDTTRLVAAWEEGSAYWCYDNQHPSNSCEIYAMIDDTGKVSAFGDVVITYPHSEQSKELIEVVSKISDFNQMPGCEWALVYSSPVLEIPNSSVILCEKGLSPTIKFRGIEMQYIRLPYVIGIADLTKSYKVRLL